MIAAVLQEKLANSLVGDLPAGTPRRVHGPLRLPRKITAVTGMRRAGKTTLVHQMRAERLAAGASRAHVPYLNFEDERLAGLTAADLNPVVEAYYRDHPALRGQETVSWCFDEIQEVPGWEKFVRRLLDTEQVEIVVTGSSAALLSREIATALRGRAWEVVLHPFGFEEALRHAGAPTAHQALPSPARSALERAFLDHLTVGGFPEAQGLDRATRFQLLRDQVDVAMLRDVIERHQVTNPAGLRWLVRHLLGNAGGAFSVEKFHQALRSQGFAISRDTVHLLLHHLQDCFLVRTVWMEASSERQRMVNPRKAYPVDPGLIPVFDRTGRANVGHALETAVFLELERRRAEVTWVRTPGGFEVDFLARHPDGSVDLIQVCADARAADTADREIRALVDAAAAHPGATPRLLALTQDALPDGLPAGVVAEPAYAWMLRSPASS